MCGFVENLVEICQMNLTENSQFGNCLRQERGHHFSVLFSTRMLCVLFGQIDQVSSRKGFFKWQMDRHRTKWDQRFGSNKLPCLLRIYVNEHPNLINRHFFYKTQKWLFFLNMYLRSIWLLQTRLPLLRNISLPKSFAVTQLTLKALCFGE